MQFLGKNKAKAKSAANKEINNQGFALEAEVKESIAGHRSEPTSVDTGRFLNSVSTDNSKFMQSRIFSNVSYAKYLENGTSRIKARRHFQNSLSRRKPKIIAAIKDAIKKA